MIAGVVSFLSPCVLPLIPGYLSYITGMSAAELGEEKHTSRVLLGCTLFVLGFTLLFVSLGAAFGTLGNSLQLHQVALQRILGTITIVLGLIFAGAFQRMPIASMELRIHRIPNAGLVGAPILGVLFGLGWTPCIGPTLSAVLGLAASSSDATAWRGAVLAFGYCLGLGIPFLIVGVAYQRSLSALKIVKRHYRALMLVGGLLLVAIGMLEVTGLWSDFVAHIQTSIPGSALL